jgi:hypothetical protein
MPVMGGSCATVRTTSAPPRLRRGVVTILDEVPDLVWLVLEGGGPLADVWEREGARRAVPALRVAAETWRARLLLDREQRSGPQAKQHADDLAPRDRVGGRSQAHIAAPRRGRGDSDRSVGRAGGGLAARPAI